MDEEQSYLEKGCFDSWWLGFFFFLICKVNDAAVETKASHGKLKREMEAQEIIFMINLEILHFKMYSSLDLKPATVTLLELLE